MELNNRTVVITGASKGIGAATARAFAAQGARLVLCARTASLLDSLVAELGAETAIAVPADMTRREDVDKLISKAVERFGRLDILINNAGVGLAGEVNVLSIDSFRRVIDLNLFGPINAIQAAVPEMKRTGGGLIINISSMVTKLPLPVIGGYRATKMALDAISDSARIELAQSNIRVSTVYPGATITDFFDNVVDRDKAGSAGWKIDSAQTAGFVAKKIVHAARREPRVQYMNLSLHLIALLGIAVPRLIEMVTSRRFSAREDKGSSKKG
jgi:short-subunit dehydrogenase